MTKLVASDRQPELRPLDYTRERSGPGGALLGYTYALVALACVSVVILILTFIQFIDRNSPLAAFALLSPFLAIGGVFQFRGIVRHSVGHATLAIAWHILCAVFIDFAILANYADALNKRLSIDPSFVAVTAIAAAMSFGLYFAAFMTWKQRRAMTQGI